MGQKANPIGLRLGILKRWESQWFARRDFHILLEEDYRIREYIKQRLRHAGIARIEIDRASGRAVINIHSARPGIIIGKKGSEVDMLRKELQDMTGKEIYINIQEVRAPELNAQLVAEGVATQLEKRVAFRRAMKRAVISAIRGGARGIKIMVAGRLAGTEIARREWYREGQVPNQTFRADIDYGQAVAQTAYGMIGVKVWIYKGEFIPESEGAAKLVRRVPEKRKIAEEKQEERE